ncbi:MAG: tetraacyldisaccharide 4'-kinase [Gallionellales bacterium RIFOXYB12_FULL_54_9]|nr:MAG: tetraacyldisaccharide 4'-kinase [Gallionellales bacterium RIFOXYB12_FULL_54_9]
MTGIEQCWYRIGFIHLILLPASWLFGALAAWRRALYHCHMLKSYPLTVPVIVIGNITVGGTGKPPLTLALAQQLIDHERHPLIISRGYGGDGCQQQVSADHTASQTGDEPLLMAKRNLCPVWVGRDRVATARQALRAHPECDIVLCDDGLQHYRLQRDVEIIVIDGKRWFGNGHLLPAGPLREPLWRLNRADALVINGSERLTDFNNQYTMTLRGEIFQNLKHPEKHIHCNELQGMRLHAVAGIGHPQRYFDHLKSLGLTVIPHAFPDHHPYQAADLAFDDCDALLLTEKDAVKCAAFADNRVWILRVDARIDSALTDHILRKITRHGCKTA